MTLVEKIKAWIDNFVNNIKKAFERVSAGTDTSDFLTYLNTAGEIEAYDVGDRVNYTTEQRKNTRPDIDRTDVVFADGNMSYSFSGDVDKTESKQVIKIVKENINKISNKSVFDEKSVDIKNYKNKSDYVLEIFNKQGNIAVNKK